MYHLRKRELLKIALLTASASSLPSKAIDAFTDISLSSLTPEQDLIPDFLCSRSFN